MKVNEPRRIRFCDEYEGLLEQFLQALVTWKQVRSLNGVAASKAEGKMELLLTEREYIGSLSALWSHSQECGLCEEILRVQVNAKGGNASTAAWCVA